MATYNVVHCTTQEEWDFVTANIAPEFKLHNTWPTYQENTCKDLERKQYCNLKFFKSHNATIYSFDEWCRLNNLKVDNLSYLTEFLIKNEIT